MKWNGNNMVAPDVARCSTLRAVTSSGQWAGD